MPGLTLDQIKRQLASSLPGDAAEAMLESALAAASLPAKPAYSPQEAAAISHAMFQVLVAVADRAGADAVTVAAEATLDADLDAALDDLDFSDFS